MNSEMFIEMSMRPDENGMTNISLVVSPEKQNEVIEILRSIFALMGINVRIINENGEEFVSSTEIFSTVTPEMMLHGLKVIENITSSELAARLDSCPAIISDIENGRSNISPALAKRLAEEFRVPYNAFL